MRRYVPLAEVKIERLGLDGFGLNVRLDQSAIASAGAAFGLDGLPDRRISFILSDESVGRDQHTVATNGWVLDNYLKNPVVLLSHDDSQPPVGRTVDIGAVGKQLRATVEFPDADTYPLGDTIYRLLKGGYMNAASVSWLPLEWKAANDRKRPGGLDFTRQELLEWSIVSVPALPSAIVTARGAGIELKPLFDWAERLLDSGNFAMVPKAELVSLRKAAKPPAIRPARARPALAAEAALAALKPLLAQAVDAMLAELIKKLESSPHVTPEALAAAKSELEALAAPAKAKIEAMAIAAERSLRPPAAARFSPDQPRAPNGEWSGDGSEPGGKEGGEPPEHSGGPGPVHEIVSKVAIGSALVASAGLVEALSEGAATVPAGVTAATGVGMIATGLADAATQLLDALGAPPAAKADAMQSVHDAAAAIKGSAPARAANPERPMPVLSKSSPLDALVRKALARDLGHVAELAMHLRSLEDLHDRMSAEADRERDGGPNVPAMRAWLDDGHKLLAGVLGEESAEDSAGTQDENSPFYWSASALEAAVARALDLAGFKRKGAKYSAETVRCIREVHGHVRSALDGLSGILSEADDENPEDEADDPALNDEDADAARALRARKAKALAMKEKIGSRQ